MTVDVSELLAQARLGGDAQALLLQPFPEGRDEGGGARLTGGEPLSRSCAADVCLDLVELGNPAQPLGGNLRAVAVEDLLQLPAGVGPTMRNADRIAALPRGARQPVLAGIAVQLQDAIEALCCDPR
ncbi:hypothetical protein LV82_02969 [Albidovulum inexpectatum]|uniref:Uncharacterized protein n=1 Tax=Albidovulum inexpectatum TaxID=196587 RepID=A0A2S5JD15_9RHOB|nr:hypothetical protein LV82_02969 [Albidovulum inexpectatum]